MGLVRRFDATLRLWINTGTVSVTVDNTGIDVSQNFVLTPDNNSFINTCPLMLNWGFIPMTPRNMHVWPRVTFFSPLWYPTFVWLPTDTHIVVWQALTCQVAPRKKFKKFPTYTSHPHRSLLRDLSFTSLLLHYLTGQNCAPIPPRLITRLLS